MPNFYRVTLVNKTIQLFGDGEFFEHNITSVIIGTYVSIIIILPYKTHARTPKLHRVDNGQLRFGPYSVNLWINFKYSWWPVSIGNFRTWILRKYCFYLILRGSFFLHRADGSLAQFSLEVVERGRLRRRSGGHLLHLVRIRRKVRIVWKLDRLRILNLKNGYKTNILPSTQ